MRVIVLVAALLMSGCVTHKSIADAQAEMAGYVDKMQAEHKLEDSVRDSLNTLLWIRSRTIQEHGVCYRVELVESIDIDTHVFRVHLLVWKDGDAERRMVVREALVDANPVHLNVDVNNIAFDQDPWQ